MALILLLEDEFDQAVLFQEYLSREGHETRICTGAREAMQYLAATPHDLVITDIFVRDRGAVVPDGGLRLIGSIRRAWKPEGCATPANVPILAVSGAFDGPSKEYFLEQAQAIGADLALPKPVEPEALHEALEKLLSA
ncbi:Response regulator receiver domain-containing protein [Pseudooceanicola antarcticus]|nr:response regulator [Pseudooceanicola antarcticus]SNY48306.1 Response regulator receiver domain-containing protein [Pseudooceanicola antarcticus]